MTSLIPLWKKFRSRSAGRVRWKMSVLILLAAAGAALVLRPWQGKASAVQPALAQPVPYVAVAKVQRQDLYRELTIPAEFRPYTEVELHAKVAGFLQSINVDFGDQVKAGQLLATLEVPELQDQLHNAVATEMKAQADYKDAHLAYTRLITVNKLHANLVAQQDLDTAEAKDNAAEDAIAAAKADVEKYETLAAYTKITAPFDGVVTRRYADPGALIQAGTASDTQSMPLVRISDNYRLRLDFPVTVDYVTNIEVNAPVEVRVESLGGKSFTGRITRFTHQVDDATRTMIVETELTNANLELVPGMYAAAVLKVEQRPQALSIPVEAVIRGAKPAVYVINRDNRVQKRTVVLGLETATQCEVESGLKEGELVMVGNTAEVRDGARVAPKFVSLLAAQ